MSSASPTTVTSAAGFGAGDWPIAGNVLVISGTERWQFYRCYRLDTATTGVQFGFWEQLWWHVHPSLSIAQNCLLAIVFGGFVGFIGALV